MGYCDIHNTNHCIECAIAKQTDYIVEAIKETNRNPIIQPQRVDLWPVCFAVMTAAFAAIIIWGF